METREQYEQRTGTKLGPSSIRLADNYHATPPNGHAGLTDAEMEAVARKDLGCSRRSTYRDLGRGAHSPAGAGRSRSPQPALDSNQGGQ